MTTPDSAVPSALMRAGRAKRALESLHGDLVLVLSRATTTSQRRVVEFACRAYTATRSSWGYAVTFRPVHNPPVTLAEARRGMALSSEYTSAIPDGLRTDVECLWNYHDLQHQLSTCDVGVGLGSHDLGVADHVVDLYRAGWFPLIAFTGANAPTTIGRFPRGEAVHYREHAVDRGVADSAIVVEPDATNTSENIAFTRRLLERQGKHVTSLLLVSRPYQQRRAHATATKVWPEVNIVCSAQRPSLDAYVRSIGDAERVIAMLVGDTQRITVYADRGFAIPQHVPENVRRSYNRLVEAGYTARLVND